MSDVPLYCNVHKAEYWRTHGEENDLLLRNTHNSPSISLLKLPCKTSVRAESPYLVYDVTLKLQIPA